MLHVPRNLQPVLMGKLPFSHWYPSFYSGAGTLHHGTLLPKSKADGQTGMILSVSAEGMSIDYISQELSISGCLRE